MTKILYYQKTNVIESYQTLWISISTTSNQVVGKISISIPLEPKIAISHDVKGCGMGTLVALVSFCFRENVVVTCKIGSVLCSLDALLQKSVIVFFFGNQISKWRSFEKRGYF